ncbi:MAG: CvpA family protein [Lachnospiraceae bacterium]|nr:CvpA family protein [Lachnospiraceae bacterium]
MDWNYLLIAVLALFVICVIQGYQKGFLRIAISLVGIVLVIAAVFILSPYVSDFLINKSGAYDSLKGKVESVFADDNAKLDNTIPENQELTIESYELPQLLKNALKQNNTDEVYKQLMVDIFEDYISGYLSRLILKASSFIGVFVVLSIVLWLALKSADLIAKIPIIKGFNKFLGLVAGFINALVITWIFFIVVVMFLGNETGGKLMEEIYRSPILTFLFNENILMKYLT